MPNNSCENTSIYDSLAFCTGQTSLPGLRKVVFYTPKRNIVRWPTLPESAINNMEEIAVYQGDFVMASDAVFKRIDMSLNKGVVDYEPQGEIPSRTFLNKGSFKHPFNNEKATAFARLANAEDFVFVTQQRDGKFRVLGNEMFETDTKVSGSTGEGTTGDVGTNINVEVTDVCPAPFYVGTLVTENGEIDCSGTPTNTSSPGTSSPDPEPDPS